jgi:DNA-binding transcriptional ArsR family regulator
MNDPVQIDRCARVLAALSAPERLRIVQYLRDGPRNVGEIAEMLQTPPVNVSHHMSVLRQASLVESRKKGRFVLYSLSPGLLDPAAGNEGVNLNLGCCRLEVPSDDKPGEG